MNTSEDDEKISAVCPMPILSSTHNVSVSCAAIMEDRSISIWLQRYSDYEADVKLLADLEQYYSNFGERLEPKTDLLCAIKNTDGYWYRGKIISYIETAAYVHYIDIGNTDQVSLESIMVLEPQFYEPHQLAVNTTLSLALVGDEVEQINVLQTHLMNKELTATFYNVHNKWIVDLSENGEKFSDKFRSLNLIKEEEVASQPVSQMPTSQKFDVYVSHVDSPTQFWLQRIDEHANLVNIQNKLQLEVTSFSAIDGILEEGTLCAAVYLFDDNWYRAEVLDADEDITTVRFIDYGNTDVIDKAGHIRLLPDTWKNIKRYADKCKLDVIPIDAEDWSQATCDRFGEIMMSVDTLQAMIVADTIPKRVELFINNKSINEILVEERHAIIISSEQAELVNEEIVDIELDPHSAFVSHINSPSEFWVQEEKSIADLEVMTDRFMVADMFPKIDAVKEGLLCVAKYPEDSQWYRARVLSNDENGIQVIFVDYGNSSISTEICALPEDLADVPLLSRKCSLELPSHIEKWSEEACNKFIKLAAEGATIFILDVLKEQETSVVKLTLHDQNVADILASLCEQHSPVIEERLPPLGEENSPNVVVSHINSPDEFWIQTESSISELEVMSDLLQDTQSFVTLKTFNIGTVCAALYPEDEHWYRAKILARHKNGTEVLYMDYGNSAVTEELRVLPQDIVNIPTLSKRCSLKKPHDIAIWSERACDKFKELAADGATMFQFEALDENDPMHVRLSLNGTNVVELLQTEDIPQAEEAIEDEAENAAFITEKQAEVVDNEPVFEEDPIEEILDIGKNEQSIEQKLTLNLNILDTNPPCLNQTEQNLENLIDDDVINKSFGDSDTGNKFPEEKPKHMMTSDEIGNINEEFEVTPEYTPEGDKILEDLDTGTCHKELSVDEIIKNMVRDTAENLDTQEINSVNLSVIDKSQSVVENDVNEHQQLATQIQSINISKTSDLLAVNEEQLQIITQDDANQQQELYSQVQSINIDVPRDIPSVELVNVNEKTSMNTTEDVIENSDLKQTLSVTDKKNETQSQNVQIDAGQIEEQKTKSEAQPDMNEPLEHQVLKSTSDDSNSLCLPKEHVNSIKKSQKQNPAEDNDAAHGSTNKNDNLQIVLKNTSTDQDISSKSTSTAEITPLLSAIKTDTIEQRRTLGSRKRSEDKIVPGCISRGESPDPEAATYSLTPKTSASIANTLQPVTDSSREENDEILTVSIEKNIP